ncbi:beta-lactamase domain protein [Vulcanisaeta distributa DSM 14429]|uniref:Beta-lactamase domain protein n=1 Tax=Vulcanisaeta distributa (strain DSM 14429 / JCM 11212 / NBRC 100878 / IC-017) TaxID=572478 RepID=E1QV24_VULDI|nr:beta-lactamase domain protein [Vulcanisaeta distributa DSM 14429]
MIEICDLDCVVIHHMEPDHNGLIKALHEKNPGITLIERSMTNKLMRSLYGISPNLRLLRTVRY